MTLRPALCPCGHGPEQHYADDRGVRWACCARGCECGAFGTRARTPVRVEQHPTEPPPPPRYIPPPPGGYT